MSAQIDDVQSERMLHTVILAINRRQKVTWLYLFYSSGKQTVNHSSKLVVRYNDLTGVGLLNCRIFAVPFAVGDNAKSDKPLLKVYYNTPPRDCFSYGW